MCFLGVKVITRCALFALRVRDSKAFQDSAPGLEFAEEQGVLSFLERDVHSVRSACEILKLLKIALPNQISRKSGLFVDHARKKGLWRWR